MPAFPGGQWHGTVVPLDRRNVDTDAIIPQEHCRATKRVDLGAYLFRRWRDEDDRFVFNDARYNMVYHGYKQQFGKEATWDTPWVDFVAWAGAMGMPGARIDRPGQITAELIRELASKGLPVVLDIRHDPSVRIKGAGRVEALQHMSAPPPSMRSSPSARPGSIPPPSGRPPSVRPPYSSRAPRSVPPSSMPSPISVRVPQSTPPLGIRGLQLSKALIPPPPAMPSLGEVGETDGERTDK